MSSNKRQQARNEKTLQDLVKSVPGNGTCADCLARNPGWASWSLGIFLCMRCAALHRKLGTHISKVKSLSMDSWTNDQVDNMRNIGNVKSNKIYNPTNIKPPVPFDVDEADSAMERFIRKKYMDKDLPGAEDGHRSTGYSRRHDTGHLNSDDDSPPPLPPKVSKGFFRSASNIFPLSSRTKKANARAEAEAQSPYINDDYNDYSPSSPRVRSKPSRVFGTHVASSGIDEHENKMLRLRDMGFLDEKRNATVLKGLNGNLDKSIETLVRLGEGNSPGRGSTARSPTSGGSSAGLTFPRSQGNDRPSVTTSSSPWDLPAPPAMPQSAQSTGTYAQNNPFQSLNNSTSFGSFPSQPQSSVGQAFNGLSLSLNPPTQLFPNHTGGHTTQGYQANQAPPPMPMIPQQFQSNPFISGQFQQQQQPQQPQQNQNYNPFIQPTQQVPQQMQQQIQQPIQQQTQQQSSYNGQNSYANNPFMNQQTQNFGQQAFYGQPQQPQQPAQYGSQQQQQQNNPYQQVQPQYQQYGSQPLQAQQTGRADKGSILALYNYPQMAPTPPPQQQESQILMNTIPQQQYPDTPTSTQHMVSPGVGTGNKNPFMSAPPNGARHVSQESISVNADWQNGRHSPDAFASLSARSLR